MNAVVLPPRYYRTHFFEMLNFVEEHYYQLLEPRELKFISQLKSLSENAQCIFVRMVNRKGNIFDQKKFAKYAEIDNLEGSFQELQNHGFIRKLIPADTGELIQFLTKPQLQKWCGLCGLTVVKTISGEELLSFARSKVIELQVENLTVQNLIVQQKSEELEYILFLFFGSVQKNLTLYTLRDLGIRQSQTLKTKFVPRFITKKEAQDEYFFVKSLISPWSKMTAAEIDSLYTKATSYSDLTKGSQNLKSELLFQFGEYWAETNPEQAAQAYGLSISAKAREKMARLFYKLDKKSDCQALLEDMQKQPRSDEELLFAEDFSLRKFNKKRKSTVTEILHQAREIKISDSYLKRPELGVCAYFENEGYQATFSENNLWNSLFGLIFWSELFESENARIHNPFERSPSDLIGPEFYLNHEPEIEAKISLLSQSNEAQKLILRTVVLHYGKLNDLFRWHTDLGRDLISFLQKCGSRDVGKILLTIAQNYQTHHVGFPDLMIEKDGNIQFIEVKAEGDNLRPGQLSRLRLLKEAGFGVEVLRVRWETDPNQIYTVVDVETTGGTANFHRITEIGAVKIQNGKIVEEFQTLINPGRAIPNFITGLTGITNEMVKDAPTFNDISEKLFEFFKGTVFVAHNVRFDYGFIQREFERAGIQFVRPLLCTCAGLRKTHPGLSSYGLKNLASHFQIDMDQHHRAMSDARAAARLLIIMNECRT